MGFTYDNDTQAAGIQACVCTFNWASDNIDYEGTYCPTGFCSKVWATQTSTHWSCVNGRPVGLSSSTISGSVTAAFVSSSGTSTKTSTNAGSTVTVTTSKSSGFRKLAMPSLGGWVLLVGVAVAVLRV